MAEDQRSMADNDKRPSSVSVATWIMAISTVTVAAVAVYGMFFTSIPEALVRQLRTDVADTKQELISIKQEKASVESELDRLRSLVVEKQNTLEEISKKRDIYLREIWNLVTKSFINAVRNRIKDVRKQERVAATDYLQLKAWRPQEIVWENRILDESEKNKKVSMLDEKIQEAPPSMLDVLRKKYIANASEAVRSMSDIELLDMRLEKLEDKLFSAQTEDRPTLRSIILDELDNGHMTRLLPDAQERFRKLVISFLEDQQESTLPLGYWLTPETSPVNNWLEIADRDQRFARAEVILEGLEEKLFAAAPPKKS